MWIKGSFPDIISLEWRTKMKYEIMAPGMVYYRNAIIDPEKTISTIEYIQDKLMSGINSVADKWQEWNGANPNTEKFCLKHWITNPDKVSSDDPLYSEIFLIYNNIFNGINNAFKHYSNEIYPAASKNIKSTEGMLSILKYSKTGYLPPHQDQGVSSRVLSTVGYLNDNYDGGEINFPYVGVTIKPEAGSVIFFPSNFIYVHEVRPMISGIRYAVPQWYHSLLEPRSSTGEE
jgi:Rps23 Pro-64 3,4-dihydroxylase Tpa1-like proline 4-hydroxylase